MAFGIRGEIKGLPELVRKLDGLKASLAKKYLRKAMRTSTSIVNKGAKANVEVGPDATGQTKRSLGVKVKVYPSGVVLGVVEPRSGFKVPIPTRGTFVSVRYHDPRRTAHLIEKGTRLRRKRSGGSSGAMPARPFLYPAFTSNESRIVQTFSDVIDEALASL